MTGDEPELGLLARHPLLSELTTDALGELSRHGRKVRFADDQTIFMKGDPGDALYGVLAGSVRIATSAPDGKEITLNLIEPGRFFGEIAALDGGPRTANAYAVGEAELLRIDSGPFSAVVRTNPVLAIGIVHLLCDRLRWTSTSLEDLVLLDAEARIAKRLLMLGSTYGRDGDDGLLVTLEMSQDEFAQMVGVTRVSVNTHFAAWKRAGILKIKRKQITIRDQDALRRIAAIAD